MSAICSRPIKASVLRLVKLDQCGNPVTGADSAEVVSNGWISIGVSPQYEEGTEFIQKAVDGSLCVNEMDPSELKRAELEILWCLLDPDALVIVTGEQLLFTGTEPSVTGTGVAYGEGPLTARFSLEVWQPISGPGQCNASGQQQYVYWAFMNSGNTRVNDFTFENGVFNYSLTSETKRVGLLWGNGPGSAGPWIEQNPEPDKHWLHNVTTTPPPVATCGAVLLS